MMKPTKWPVHPPSDGSDQPVHLPSLINLHCALWVAKDANLLQADSKYSDQADLSLRWVHQLFCRFCRAPVQIFLTSSFCLYNVLSPLCSCGRGWTWCWNGRFFVRSPGGVMLYWGGVGELGFLFSTRGFVLLVLEPCNQSLVFVSKLSAHQSGLPDYHYILNQIYKAVTTDIYFSFLKQSKSLPKITIKIICSMFYNITLIFNGLEVQIEFCHKCICSFLH